MESIGAELLPIVVQDAVRDQVLEEFRKAPAFGFPHRVFSGDLQRDRLENLREDVLMQRGAALYPAQEDRAEQIAIDPHLMGVRLFRKDLVQGIALQRSQPRGVRLGQAVRLTLVDGVYQKNASACDFPHPLSKILQGSSFCDGLEQHLIYGDAVVEQSCLPAEKLIGDRFGNIGEPDRGRQLNEGKAQLFCHRDHVFRNRSQEA